MVLLLILLSLFLPFKVICLADPLTVGQVERSQEILREEEALRAKIEKEEKVFIKKILVNGSLLLDKDEINEIILPFMKHWLDKTDIEQILGSFSQAYYQKGYAGLPIKISYQINKNILIITIKEK